MNDPRRPAATEQISSTQFLTLSLFLLLLAFFIALTAGAEFDEDKTAPVLDSLEKVFPVQELRGRNSPAPAPDEKSLGAGKSLERIDGLFNSDLFPFDTNTQRNQGAVVIGMSGGDLEQFLVPSAENIVTPLKRQQFFAALSSMMQENTLTLMLPAGQNPSAADIRQAEMIKDALIANGLTQQKIIIGSEGRADNRLNLVFRKENL